MNKIYKVHGHGEQADGECEFDLGSFASLEEAEEAVLEKARQVWHNEERCGWKFAEYYDKSPLLKWYSDGDADHKEAFRIDIDAYLMVNPNDPTYDEVKSVAYRYMRNERKDEGAEFVAKVLSDFVNGGGSAKLFADACMNDHRTLVQGKMGLAFALIVEAARMYRESDYDARNEYAVTLANEIWMLLGTENIGRDGEYHKLCLGVPLI